MNNKSYIFNKSFDKIFTKERLSFTINKLKLNEDLKSFEDNNIFDFIPHHSFLIPKNLNEFRKISIPSSKLKIIQTILAEELNYKLKFSDRSYAYRQNKGPLKAINRVKDIVKKFEFVIKIDIKSFFDTIDHSILIEKLSNIISDNKIIYLIALMIKNGSLFRNRWEDKLEGVHQGDVLSPLLSNIYLYKFDKFFEYKDIEFVRFADDIIFFSKSYKEANNFVEIIKNELSKLKLSINENKFYITHKSKTFEYLGVRFDENSEVYSIDNDRLMQKISKISQETKNRNLVETIEILNNHIQGFLVYYSKIINNSFQLEQLQTREDEILISKIINSKQNKNINRKDDFIKLLNTITTYIPKRRDTYISEIVSKSYEKMKLEKPETYAKTTIQKTKTNFQKNHIKSRELIITKIGSYLSFYRGKIRVKTKDEEIKEVGYKQIERIVITTTKCSISVYLINMCAKNGIDIDFIENNEPYALLTYSKNISHKLHIKQLNEIEKNGLEFAKNIQYSKAKNQLNLLKYYNLRRDNEKLNGYIDKIESLIKKISNSKKFTSLMGVEGQISSNYWSAFGVIIKKEGFQRTHKDSKDSINQALNYGYAILYNRIQASLLKEGLNIYYAFLHSNNYQNPSLVYDFIEPFRTPVVDREIIALFVRHHNIKIKSNNLLDEKSKKLITEHIQKRLASTTKTKYGKTTFNNLIDFETNELKRNIEKGTIHKFYLAKY